MKRKFVHISDIHVHDRQANMSAVAEGITSLLDKGDPFKKGLDILRRGVNALSAAKRMGFAIKEDRPDLRRILMDDILREEPDHVIISGDLTNTALKGEFDEARRCFERFIPERRLSVVPGNHDYPVFMENTGTLGDYFHDVFPKGKVKFPWVKLLGSEFALIGLNSCLEIFDFLANPEVVVHTARGKLHRDQLLALEEILTHPKLEGRTVIVVLHHHVLAAPRRAGGASQRLHNYFMERATNADYLLRVLKKAGAAMVLHGHRHIRQISPDGKLVVIGAGSAIFSEPPYEPAPSYNIYEFEDGVPRITVKALDGNRYSPVLDERFLPGRKAMQLWRYGE